MIRKARKRYRCQRQRYWDRLNAETREWYGATPCPRGEWIEVGDQYEEAEGIDVFHPDRYHIGCFEEAEAAVEAVMAARKR